MSLGTPLPLEAVWIFSVLQGSREHLSFEDLIHYEYWHWCTKISKRLSNFCELLKLVDTLELKVWDGQLQNCEVFIFTDNTIAESVFYKGSLTSKRLFKLILQFWHLETHRSLTLHMVYLVGMHKVAKGANRGSYSDLNQGAIIGEDAFSNLFLCICWY